MVVHWQWDVFGSPLNFSSCSPSSHGQGERVINDIMIMAIKAQSPQGPFVSCRFEGPEVLSEPSL